MVNDKKTEKNPPSGTTFKKGKLRESFETFALWKTELQRSASDRPLQQYASLSMIMDASLIKSDLDWQIIEIQPTVWIY